MILDDPKADFLVRLVVTVVAGASLALLVAPFGWYALHWLVYVPMFWVLKRDRPVQIGDHRATRLDPRQVQPVKPDQMEFGPHQNRVAVPAERCRVPAEGQRLQPGPVADHLARQGRGPLAGAEIRLLQRDKVGPQGRDPVQYPTSIAAQVGAKASPDVPGRNFQFWL